MGTFYVPLNVRINVTGPYCQIPPYRHLLNTDPSLLRTACFALGKESLTFSLYSTSLQQCSITRDQYTATIQDYGLLVITDSFAYFFFLFLYAHFLRPPQCPC